MFLKILLANPDHSERKRIRKFLKTENWTVDEVGVGSAVKKQLKSGKYDAVVLDLMFADQTGFAVIKQIRAIDRAIPVIVTSPVDVIYDRINAIMEGADDFLVFGFGSAELIARLKAASLRKTVVASGAERLACGKLELDLSNLTVWCCGQKIALSKKEFQILAELMKNPNRPVSRGSLVRAIWGMDEEDFFSNTVDVHIRYLRKKIDEAFPGSENAIQTVRGVGYRIAG